MSKILIVAVHPDDETPSYGGTIVKHDKQHVQIRKKLGRLC